MELYEWKETIISKALKQIAYRNNMSQSDIDNATTVLSIYLDEGINILRSWRKMKDDNEFLSGKHDNGLIDFIKAKDQSNGRDLFEEYTSGGIKANFKITPENRLKGSCKQVM